MKIRTVRLYQHDLPILGGPYVMSSGPLEALDTTLVEIETEDGATGWGETCPLGPVYAPAFAEGDAAAGEKVYKKCKTCHSLEAGKNKLGPHLAGVIGREAGSVEGFKYSKAMADSGLVWDEATLDAFLAKPKEVVPKSKMAFAGLKKEQQRQDLIAYLKEAAQ